MQITINIYINGEEVVKTSSIKAEAIAPAKPKLSFEQFCNRIQNEDWIKHWKRGKAVLNKMAVMLYTGAGDQSARLGILDLRDKARRIGSRTISRLQHQLDLYEGRL